LARKPETVSFWDRLYMWYFYRKRALEHDLPERKVGWRSRRNQELRFGSLTRIGDLKGQRILDLGCGLGCLYGFLVNQGWEGEYTGYDILGFMVKGAKKRYPGVQFEKRDFLASPPQRTWDYILINGVFNHKVKDNWAWIEEMVAQTMSRAEKGVAFNILVTGQGWGDEDLFYADPGELEKRANRWTGGNYRILRDYMEDDMAVHLFHPIEPSN
jgi:SAM-dependent methyltransferase